MSDFTRHSGLLSVAMAMLALSGCSVEHSPAESAWFDEIKIIHANPPSDLVRRVTEDGHLDVNEIRELMQATNDCFALIGSAFAVQEEEDGSFSLTIPFERGSSAQETIDAMSPELLEASWACEERYWRDLGFLWNAIQRNPYNLDFDEMIVQCLIRSSLAVETLTVSDLRRLADLSFREDGIMQRLPGGPPLDDPAVWPCIHDPHHN